MALTKADILAIRTAESDYKARLAAIIAKMPENSVELIREANGTFTVLARSSGKTKEIPVTPIDMGGA